MIRYLKQKFRPRRTDDAGNAIPRIWIGDQEEAVLVDTGATGTRFTVLLPQAHAEEPGVAE